MKYYVVRNGNNNAPGAVPGSSWRGSNASNAFRTFQEAKTKALEWAGKWQGNSYDVYEVTRVGSATPSAVPAKWKDDVYVCGVPVDMDQTG